MDVFSILIFYKLKRIFNFYFVDYIYMLEIEKI